MLNQHKEVNNNQKENNHKMVEISYEMAKLVGGGEKPKQSGSAEVKCVGKECSGWLYYQTEW